MNELEHQAEPGNLDLSRIQVILDLDPRSMVSAQHNNEAAEREAESDLKVGSDTISVIEDEKCW